MATRLRATAEPRTLLVRRRAASRRHGRRRPESQWKVAYADFATAMMAFFMLLWLVSSSQSVSLAGLADYFTPAGSRLVSDAGTGGALNGLAAESDGSRASAPVTDRLNPGPRVVDPAQPASDLPTDPVLQRAEATVRNAIAATPALAALKDNLRIAPSPEGLRIDLTDAPARPMFAPGAIAPTPDARAALAVIGQIVARQPQRLSIQGHSARGSEDAGDAWELSAARANAVRRLFERAGIYDHRFAEVAGRASADPLYPQAPDRPENRRVTIVLLREAAPTPADFGRGTR